MRTEAEELPPAGIHRRPADFRGPLPHRVRYLDLRMGRLREGH